MKRHTEIYLNYFGFSTADFVPCEIPGCYLRAVDVCHIDARGMGGDPQGKKDRIDNLMGKCRGHHNEYGDIKELKPLLREIHSEYMKTGKEGQNPDINFYKLKLQK